MRFTRSIAAALSLLLAQAAHAGEVKVLTPGVIANSGLREIATVYSAKTGVKITVVPAGMGSILSELKTAAAPSDIVMLPMELMSTAALQKAIQRGSFTPLGRVEVGLFKKAGAPMPKIDTVEQLAAALKGASVIFYTDPKSGSMQAGISDRLLKRPEFAGAKGQPIQGDAEPALKRGDGDATALGLGLVHDAHPAGQPSPNPYLVGPLPVELGAHMDMATALSSRATNAGEAQAFIQYLLGPEAAPIWQAKGVDRY